MSHVEAAHHSGAPASPFRQPKAVWAVAFACVISFMGIGLVDPILPALSSQLHATPAQVSLLFTSYLLVTAFAMLVTNWVSSRIGAKRTLMLGLAIIVIFAFLAGTSGSIGGIVGFRAGWGLGNALFIATSLAVIVASASGGFGGAIILYETALGLGIAVGPLLGGLLGDVSWRGPFYGVSALMAVALIATTVLVEPTLKPAHRTSLAAPLKALRHRGLLIMSLTALCYNWGFFTLLGYAPYPMRLSALNLGFVFTAWGLLVALCSVWVAPRLHRRFGAAPTLYANMVVLAILLGVIGVWTSTPNAVIVATVLSGAAIGINNTLTTQAVMTVAPVERPVASAAYGFVRFIGGGLAPYAAGKLAEHFDIHVPFLTGALAFLVAIAVLSTGHKILTQAEHAKREPVADESPAATVETVKPLGASGVRPVVVAVDASSASASVAARAAEIAAERNAPLDVVHVQEIDVIADSTVELESLDDAIALLRARLDRLTDAGVRVSGHVMRSVADHVEVGALLADHADRVNAQLVVVGPPASTGSALRGFAETASAGSPSANGREVMVVYPEESTLPVGGD
jgi:MFS family permease